MAELAAIVVAAALLEHFDLVAARMLENLGLHLGAHRHHRGAFARGVLAQRRQQGQRMEVPGAAIQMRDDLMHFLAHEQVLHGAKLVEDVPIQELDYPPLINEARPRRAIILTQFTGGEHPFDAVAGLDPHFISLAAHPLDV